MKFGMKIPDQKTRGHNAGDAINNMYITREGTLCLERSIYIGMCLNEIKKGLR